MSGIVGGSTGHVSLEVPGCVPFFFFFWTAAVLSARPREYPLHLDDRGSRKGALVVPFLRVLISPAISAFSYRLTRLGARPSNPFSTPGQTKILRGRGVSPAHLIFVGSPPAAFP